MPRRSARPRAERTRESATTIRDCPACGRRLWSAGRPRRAVVALEGLVRLRLQVRSCRNPECPRHRVGLRPEREGRHALPQHGFGLDVVAPLGVLRHAEHRSAPEIDAELARRGVPISPRSVGNLPDLYDESPSLSCSDAARLEAITPEAGRLTLAIDGLQPDLGREVLRMIRDVLSGEVMLARSLRSSTQDDLGRLLGEVRDAPGVPIARAVSDGHASIRKAVAEALEGVPLQLCHSHHLGEAATPMDEADRQARVQFEVEVRGIRPIEREAKGRDDVEARANPWLLRGGPTGLDPRRPPEASG